MTPGWLDALAPAQWRALQALGVVLLYAGLCALTWWRHRGARLQVEREAAALLPAEHDLSPVLVAHASQTGFAEQLARQAAQALHTAGIPCRLVALGQLTPAALQQAERALFIVSTYGEGDAPDSAAPFTRRVMPAGVALGALHYGLLALGDRGYRHFCGFGRALDAWLGAQGAQPLFERVEAGNGDAEALQAWQRHLARIAGTTDLPDWQAPPFQPWRLAQRRLLNPGSQGEPVFHLELVPAQEGARPGWEAGDLVQVLGPADRERPREYSIASVPADGAVHLLVRQQRRDDGSLGLASGWLTAQAGVGDTIELRLREHPHFRLGANAQRALILIGNGTGLAGLRGHLRAQALRARTGAAAPPAWLLFGERQAAHDRLYGDEIDAWLASGLLARADRVYSRDPGELRYVQHGLRQQADRLRDWVAQGAAIYVCGSLEGMAAGVDEALHEALGSDMVERLQEEGRYRRDVY